MIKTWTYDSCLALFNKTFLQLHILFLCEVVMVHSTGPNYSGFLLYMFSVEKRRNIFSLLFKIIFYWKSIVNVYTSKRFHHVPLRMNQCVFYRCKTSDLSRLSTSLALCLVCTPGVCPETTLILTTCYWYFVNSYIQIAAIWGHYFTYIICFLKTHAYCEDRNDRNGYFEDCKNFSTQRHTLKYSFL